MSAGNCVDVPYTSGRGGGCSFERAVARQFSGKTDLLPAQSLYELSDGSADVFFFVSSLCKDLKDEMMPRY